MAQAKPQAAELPLGDFEIDDRRDIGTGGFARVYAIKFRGQEVVVKVPTMPDPDEEIPSLASIAHRNIVTFFGFVRYDERKCPVMELAPLGSVRDVLRRGEVALLRSSRAAWIRDVAKAIKYLHVDAPTPMVHGDIKGANVLIFPEPNERTLAKVADFGQARPLLDTTAAEKIGTHLWSPPEVLAEEAHSRLSDVWSFGCMVVELVSEREPYRHHHQGDRREIKQVLRKIEDRKLEPLEGLQVTWPPGLQDVVRRCLQLDYTKRPSMEEVLNDLQPGAQPSQTQATQAPALPTPSVPPTPPRAAPETQAAQAPSALPTPRTARFYIAWWFDTRMNFDLEFRFDPPLRGRRLRQEIGKAREVEAKLLEMKQDRARRAGGGELLVFSWSRRGWCDESGVKAEISDAEGWEDHIIADDDQVPLPGDETAWIEVTKAKK